MHLDQAAHQAAVAHNLPPHAFFWEDEATGPVVSRYKIVTRNEMTATKESKPAKKKRTKPARILTMAPPGQAFGLNQGCEFAAEPE
jgi:hypothetical protein